MRTQATDYPSCPIPEQPPLTRTFRGRLWAFLAALLLHALLCLAFAASWHAEDFAAFSSGGGGGGGFWLRLNPEGLPGVQGEGQYPSGRSQTEAAGDFPARGAPGSAAPEEQGEKPSVREVRQNVSQKTASKGAVLPKKLSRHDLRQKKKQVSTLREKPGERAEKNAAEKSLEAASPAKPGNVASASASGLAPGGGGGGSSQGHGNGWGDGEGEGIGPGRGSGSGGGTGSGHGTGTGAGIGPGMGMHDAAFGGAGGPSFLRYVPPDYPASARRRGESGVVLLEVWINAGGTATRVEVVKGVSEALDRAAADSVRRARFVPYRKDGRPRDCRTRIPVRFRLR